MHNNEQVESSTLSISAGSQIAQVCLVSFLAIKDTLLNILDAPFLGTGKQKVVHCQCQFENEFLL